MQISVQRLSSGLRNNSAKGDATGLADAQRMALQINRLNQAVRSVNNDVRSAVPLQSKRFVCHF
ncbi:flagellin N-terminal helical domain-containing protein [Noviherbaspirillum pedocola]|uniref:flagellin N-terminal helical domain-containing protein n=1 Tax=Noviherbaspirillum pedocola TaxID=2801341 RepID=UPI001F3AF286|nr:hypothetical protein [Noviherbaspirillum pedocola]